MRQNLNVSVSGSTTDNSGKNVSNMRLSFDLDYDPIALLKNINDNFPAMKVEIERFVQQVILSAAASTAPANDNAPSPKEDGMQFQPAEAATDIGDEFELELDDEDSFDDVAWLDEVVIPPQQPTNAEPNEDELLVIMISEIVIPPAQSDLDPTEAKDGLILDAILVDEDEIPFAEIVEELNDWGINLSRPNDRGIELN